MGNGRKTPDNFPTASDDGANLRWIYDGITIPFSFLSAELLERVLLRLGYADTDEQLQTTITKFLTPVLIKITSPNENVRKKV